MMEENMSVWLSIEGYTLQRITMSLTFWHPPVHDTSSTSLEAPMQYYVSGHEVSGI